MKKVTILALLILIPFVCLQSQWIIQNISASYSFYAVNFKSPMTGWVAGSNGAVYKTTNSGNNWTYYSTGMTNGALYTLAFPTFTAGWTAGYSSVLGNTGYIYKTSNGGNTWSTSFTTANHIFYASYSPDSMTCYVAGTYLQTSSGTIMKTANGGSNWTAQVSGLYGALYSLYFINSNTGWAAGNGTVLKTTNAGANWLNYSVSSIIYSLYFSVDGMTGWAGAANGQLLKSTNGGMTWLEYMRGVTYSPITSIQFPAPSIAYFSNGSVVFKTNNMGANWTPMETGSQSDIKAMQSLSVTNCYGVNIDGNLIYTTNGGGNYNSNTLTFRRSNLNKPIVMNGTAIDTLMVNVSAPNNLVLDVNFLIDTVFNTIDSNLTFILTHEGINDTVVYRAGGGGNNFIRTVLNDSATISINNATPPFTGSYKPSRPLSVLNYTSLNGPWYLRVKESNTGIRTGVIKSWGITVNYNANVSVKKISEIVPDKFLLYQNYPNPFNPNTNIKYQIANSKLVIIKIFDILGKEVVTLVNEKQSPGVYEVAFDGSKLPSGVYFYRLNAGDYTETKKMILIK